MITERILPFKQTYCPQKTGWIEVKLGDICKLKNGFAFKSSEYKTEGIPIIRISDIKEGIVTCENSIKIEPKTEYEDYIIEKNDILIAMSGATTGKFGIFKDKLKAYQNQRVGNFKFFDNGCLNKSFLFYQLYSLKRRIEKDAYGGAQPNISSKKIEEMEIIIAPLPEQRAIVSKIEQLFSELDNGISNLKLAQEQLKVYRQAVLDKTTKTEKFVPINNIINELGQGWSPKCHNEPSINYEEWGVIKTTAIQAGYFDEKENKRLPAHLEPRVKHELKAGDILITRAGPRVRVGVCCLVKKVRPRLINCDKAYRIRLKENLILPQFFEYTLNSPKYTRMTENLKTGINDSGVNLTQNRFLDLEIPLPSLLEQQAIVLEIETRLSVCDKIEQDIQTNLEKAEALRQSILKKAFEGKLLSEKELAEVRGAEDWEPAEVLLEKITVERKRK